VPNKKYHLQQAEILAKLAASTSDRATADNLRLLVLEHLERAERKQADGRGSTTSIEAADNA
jgi:hypothetical protein